MAGGSHAAHNPASDAQSGNLVLSQIPSKTSDVIKFRRFRFNLVRLLRLPLDISEKDLRDAIMQCSVNVFANYVARARRAVAESGVPVAATVCQADHAIERSVERPPESAAAV